MPFALEVSGSSGVFFEFRLADVVDAVGDPWIMPSSAVVESYWGELVGLERQTFKI